EVFIDLYNVVRNGVLIGEPSYSIKNVERIYRKKRDKEVVSGGDSIVVYEEWRSHADGLTWETSEILKAIRDYNIDDCNSTQELAEWLRLQQSTHKIEYSRKSDEEVKIEDEEVTEVTKLREKLLDMALQETDKDKKDILQNLAWLLEFHKRENKPTWWRLFDRLGLTEIDLNDDMDCLVGLRRTKREAFLPTPRSRNYVYEYSFDKNQPFKGQSKSYYVIGDDNFIVNALDLNVDEGLIEIQSKLTPPDRVSLVPNQFVNPDPIPGAIQDVIEKLIKSDFNSSAIVDFLQRKQPRFLNGSRNAIIKENLSGSEFIDTIVSVANELDNSYLCIQGPPGAGKTFTARHIIADLIAKGKTIGISSNSHKVIINLMGGVADYLLEKNINSHLIKVGGDDEDLIFNKDNVSFRKDAKACRNDLNKPSTCIGGTAWLFCNSLLTEEHGTEKFDYLFIDEAGQVSIANLVGMSRVANNLILMGDQMQLGQPIQGSHPDESGQSILEYLLKDKSTISPDMGVFLPETYRMHPDICRLISDNVYDSRLHSATVTKRHIVNVPREILPRKQGIHFVPVIHEGNTQGSEEEVVIIKDLAQKLINIPYWSEYQDGPQRLIEWSDMLFVAPYNYQVNLLKAALNSDARVGSVDKFQGQEAPIVFLSMCASDATESPRGIEFLFSKNRLNVAISRAQSLAIIVGSPTLAETSVSNLHQMELVSFFSEIVKFS
ncbi:MAG: helicase, partial [Proteobacteria bacterium]|nr:helicase [Pseudomonadota bacterium]